MTLLILLSVLLGGVVHVYGWASVAYLGRKWGAGHRDTVGRLLQFRMKVLTDRQLQFWEDVDEGLDEIENFYRKTGQNIERIRQFSKRFVLPFGKPIL